MNYFYKGFFLALLSFGLLAFAAPTSSYAQDFDGDGITDATDLDSDGDGISDAIEGTDDFDGDGQPNYLDLDSDNDGILDNIEAQATASYIAPSGTDTDGDGMDDAYDTDDGGTAITPVDTDGDGMPDYLDLDSDNDLIYDYVEGHDFSDDGYPDAGSPANTGVRLDFNDRTDSDGDGILDVYDNDGAGATDGIGGPTAYANSYDASTTELDWREMADMDGDNVVDAIDLDSDGDGIPNTLDGPTDAISNSSVNIVSTTTAWTSSCPGTAFISQYNGSGTDFYYYDMETGDYSQPQNYPSSNVNSLGYNPLDGRVWAWSQTSPDEFHIFDPNDFSTATVVTFSVDTRYAVASQPWTGGFLADGGKKYVLALNRADYDGIGVDESGFMIVDIDPNSPTYLQEIDRWVNAGNTYAFGFDAALHPDGFVYSVDNGGVLRRVDLFGDRSVEALGDPNGASPGAQWFSPEFGFFYAQNDGASHTIPDVQGFSTSTSADGAGSPIGDFNGAIATGNLDGCACSGARVTDSDNDGSPDYLDIDADNDGITDVTEATGTFDADGRGGSGTDVDGDGLDDAFDSNQGGTPINILDTDNDGIVDFLDLDSDNDAIPDYIEGVCSECIPSDGGAGTGMAITPNHYQSNVNTTDANENGLYDAFENLDNTNNAAGTNIGINPENTDGTDDPDYRDTDSDNDGFMDWTEGFDVSGNGYTYPEIHTRGLAFEGAAASPPGIFTTADDDGDGIYDWLDNDPSTAGFTETARPPFLDPENTLGLTTFRVPFADANNNGLIDIYDPFIVGGEETPTPRNGGTNDDWRDATVNTPLPIEILYFQAQREEQVAQLTWASTEEINASHYEVERSADAVRFQMIGRVNAQGNSTQTEEYAFIDEQPLSGINYYRLRKVDVDGSYEYTETRSVRFEQLSGEISLFPNPVQDELQVRLPQDLNNQVIQVELSNALGQAVLQTEWNVQGNLYETLNLGHLAKGMYYLKMRTLTWQVVHPLRKQ